MGHSGPKAALDHLSEDTFKKNSILHQRFLFFPHHTTDYFPKSLGNHPHVFFPLFLLFGKCEMDLLSIVFFFPHESVLWKQIFTRLLYDILDELLKSFQSNFGRLNLNSTSNELLFPVPASSMLEVVKLISILKKYSPTY